MLLARWNFTRSAHAPRLDRGQPKCSPHRLELTAGSAGFIDPKFRSCPNGLKHDATRYSRPLTSVFADVPASVWRGRVPTYVALCTWA